MDLTKITLSQIKGDGSKINNVADPVEPQDVATKAYVDANAGGGSGLQEGANISLLVNDAGYITAVSEGDVTAHQAALTITESQISDLGTYLTDAPADGNLYARIDGTWAQVAAGGGGSSTNWIAANNGEDFAAAPSAGQSNTIAIGHAASTYGENDICIGYGASADYRDNNIVIGTNAVSQYGFLYSGQNIVIGANAKGGKGYSVAIGKSAEAFSKYSVAIGDSAETNGTSSDYTTAIGPYARTWQAYSTSLGYQAGIWNQAGAQTGYENTTCLGRGSRVSGADQVQLGDSATTTYAYGAVQDRSDERDKADITDTTLGLTFVNALRPVEFRWDYREDYFDQAQDEEGNPILVPVAKDGSRKRNRKHQGLIAQEVKATMDSFGVDFAGYQDHSLNGGEDVRSIGYQELIPVLIKAVQELTARVEALEAGGA